MKFHLNEILMMVNNLMLLLEYHHSIYLDNENYSHEYLYDID